MDIKAKVTLDAAGRLVLPKPVRDALHLSPGDSLDLELKDDEVRLHRLIERPVLQRENGIWILRTGKALSVDAARRWLEEQRQVRDRRNAEPEG